MKTVARRCRLDRIVNLALSAEAYLRSAHCSDWEIYGPDSPHSVNLTEAPRQVYKRRLGPTEVSYYLGSRGEGVDSGVNDM